MAKSLSSRADVLVALFFVAVVAMLLVPLPPGLIDLLIALNIAVSLLLLLVALYVDAPATLLSFPALLLLTTLFRLGLNVASTRLILHDAYAGEIIQSFGAFLIRGDVLVGVVIFTIITVVNFIVVTKGSSRIAEVAARFTLDALPGKQVAIDSDLRSGLLSPQQAQSKREELRKESQFYGSMDGAMRFVQGDVVAGILIIFTNILGGIWQGLKNGVSLGDALHTYTVLTVGDGLVTQIPALMISVCAGIVVTRISSGESSSLGGDVLQQILAKPMALFISAALLVLVGFLPDVPQFPFWLGATLFVVLGVAAQRRQRPAPTAVSLVVSDAGRVSAGPAIAYNTPELPSADVLLVSLDPALIADLYLPARERYEAFWGDLRSELSTLVGVQLPALSVTADATQQAFSYKVQLRGAVIESGQILLDHVLVDMSPEAADIFGLPITRIDQHPLSAAQVVWCPRQRDLDLITRQAEIRSYDPFEALCLRAAAFLRGHPEEILRLVDVQRAVQQLSQTHSGLVAEVLDRKLMDVGRLTELAQQLVREGLSVASIRQLLEDIAAFDAHCRFAGQDRDWSLEELVGFVRQRRSRELIAPLLSAQQRLRIVTLGPEVEEQFEDLLVQGPQSYAAGGTAGLRKAGPIDRLKDGLARAIEPMRTRGLLPVAVLCRSDLKGVVQNCVRRYNMNLRVVLEEELNGSIIVERAGVWGI